MAFSRRFPLDKPGSPYPAWEEIFLTEKDEEKISKEQQQANVRLLRECLLDAKNILFEEDLKDFQTDMVNLAIALFEKRASHAVHWKEEETKKRFDKKFHK